MSNLTFIIGFMGAGKTSYARKWASKNSCKFIDSDQIISLENNMSISDIFSKYGEQYFRILEHNFLKNLTESNAVISCGGGMPCFYDNILMMKEKGNVIWLDTKFQYIYSRISKDSSRPLRSNFDSLKLLYHSRLKYYNLASERIIK